MHVLGVFFSPRRTSRITSHFVVFIGTHCETHKEQKIKKTFVGSIFLLSKYRIRKKHHTSQIPPFLLHQTDVDEEVRLRGFCGSTIETKTDVSTLRCWWIFRLRVNLFHGSRDTRFLCYLWSDGNRVQCWNRFRNRLHRLIWSGWSF